MEEVIPIWFLYKGSPVELLGKPSLWIFKLCLLIFLNQKDQWIDWRINLYWFLNEEDPLDW